MCGRTSLWAVLVMLLILQPAMEKIDVITCKELKWNQAFKTKQLQPVSGLFHATVLIFGIILFFFHASVSPLQWMLPFLPSSTFQPISIRSTHSIIFAEPCTVVVLRTAHQRISVEIIEYSCKWAQIQYHESHFKTVELGTLSLILWENFPVCLTWCTALQAWKLQARLLEILFGVWVYSQRPKTQNDIS